MWGNNVNVTYVCVSLYNFSLRENMVCIFNAHSFLTSLNRFKFHFTSIFLMISTLIAYASTNAEVKERLQFFLFLKLSTIAMHISYKVAKKKLRKIKSLAEVL